MQCKHCRYCPRQETFQDGKDDNNEHALREDHCGDPNVHNRGYIDSTSNANLYGCVRQDPIHRYRHNDDKHHHHSYSDGHSHFRSSNTEGLRSLSGRQLRK
jgi:hypothetical protein